MDGSFFSAVKHLRLNPDFIALSHTHTHTKIADNELITLHFPSLPCIFKALHENKLINCPEKKLMTKS